VRLGRYGPYAQIGDKDTDEKLQFASLRPGQSMHTISLDEALELFKLPRKLGQAENGDEVSVGIGRFGPFVKQGGTYASLKPEDDPYTIELPRALQIVSEKLEMLANRVIKDFGNGVQVLNGRYGPYITDGEKNARIPKDQEPKELTEAQCLELLAAAPVKKGRGSARKATKKAAPAAKKTAVKKAAAPKKTAAKTATKKAGATKKASTKTTSTKSGAAKKAPAKKAAAKKSAARSKT
jgi:DNA topoisomerase-1